MNSNNLFNLIKVHEDSEIEHISMLKQEEPMKITPVYVYYMMQYKRLDEIRQIDEFDLSGGYLPEAGYLAGVKYAKKILDLNTKFDEFINNLQNELQEIKITHLCIEAFDSIAGDVTITIGHKFESCEIPIKNNNVFIYDENFICGILETYTRYKYEVHKIGSWYVKDGNVMEKLIAA